MASIDLQFVERAAEPRSARRCETKAAYHVVDREEHRHSGHDGRRGAPRPRKGVGQRAPAPDFGLGMNPEFLTEGTAVEDFLRPDRLVLGGIDKRTQDVLEALYAGFDAAVPRILTNPRTAEMIKYASNAVLATMISFSNEIARLCSAVGNIDVLDVMQGVHAGDLLHARAMGDKRRDRRHCELPRGGLRLRRQLPAEGRDGADRPGPELGLAMPLLR